MSLPLLSLAGVTRAATAPPVDQHYLFEARQMQALSLSVHIPLVCFGIAFPALVLFAEWRYLRIGDPGGRGELDDLRRPRLGARARRAAARGLRRHRLRHGRQPARAIMRSGRDRIEIYLS